MSHLIRLQKGQPPTLNNQTIPRVMLIQSEINLGLTTNATATSLALNGQADGAQVEHVQSCHNHGTTSDMMTIKVYGATRLYNTNNSFVNILIRRMGRMSMLFVCL